LLQGLSGRDESGGGGAAGGADIGARVDDARRPGEQRAAHGQHPLPRRLTRSVLSSGLMCSLDCARKQPNCFSTLTLIFLFPRSGFELWARKFDYFHTTLIIFIAFWIVAEEGIFVYFLIFLLVIGREVFSTWTVLERP